MKTKEIVFSNNTWKCVVCLKKADIYTGLGTFCEECYVQLQISARGTKTITGLTQEKINKKDDN